jgi:hypothetical protein
MIRAKVQDFSDLQCTGRLVEIGCGDDGNGTVVHSFPALGLWVRIARKKDPFLR